MPTLANSLPDGGLLGFRDVDSAPDPLAYASFLDHFAASFCEMIATGLDLLRLQDGAAVLDLGCGHGAAFPALAARVGASGRIVGLDASRTLLAEAAKRFGESGLPVQCNLGDAHALPFPAGTFDAARADRVFLFLRDPAVALAELIRVTKPGGRLVVSESDLETAAVDAADDRAQREKCWPRWQDGCRTGGSVAGCAPCSSTRGWRTSGFDYSRSRAPAMRNGPVEWTQPAPCNSP